MWGSLGKLASQTVVGVPKVRAHVRTLYATGHVSLCVANTEYANNKVFIFLASRKSSSPVLIIIKVVTPTYQRSPNQALSSKYRNTVASFRI